MDNEQKKKIKKAYLKAEAKREAERSQTMVANYLEDQYQKGHIQRRREDLITDNIIGVGNFIVVSVAAGWLYWVYLTWTLGSWLMVVLLFLFPISALLGFWSLVFGTPEWVYYVFS